MKKRLAGITWQTGSDESVLYADPASLKDFADRLLRAAEDLEKMDEIRITDHVLHPSSDVRIDWIVKVESEEELLQRIAEHH
jgi:hypothetical protein